MCRVLDVSRGGFYDWLNRAPSARSKANTALLQAIEEAHATSDGTYGSPRVQAEVEESGPPASLNRVARVMREAGIQGVSPRKWMHTTLRTGKGRAGPDLVKRDFTATGPNQLWVADITYVPTWGRPSCWMSGVAGSWAGPWPAICERSWFWRRWTWPSSGAGRKG
jgi:putative transposase